MNRLLADDEHVRTVFTDLVASFASDQRVPEKESAEDRLRHLRAVIEIVRAANNPGFTDLEREILILRYLAGMRVAEIAAELGMDESRTADAGKEANRKVKAILTAPQDSPGSFPAIDRAVAEFASAVADSQIGFPDESDAVAFGRRAFDLAFGSRRRTERHGPTLASADVAELLGISRQALAKRVRAGSVVALPGPHSTAYSYPHWQFDTTRRDVRSGVREIVAVFRDALDDDYSAETLSIWMTTPNSNLERNRSPTEWLADGGPPSTVVALAEETAARLAQ